MVFVLASLIALHRIGGEPVSQHYFLFTEAGKYFWRHQSPYGVPISPIGLYFYSPACAMFFFYPFSLLPTMPGEFIYVLLSWAVFVYGSFAFIKELKLRNSQWYWLFITAQILGAIWATKIEIVMTGLLLLCVSWILRKKWPFFSALLLGMIACWKFQPLPALGLVCLALFTLRRDYLWPLGFAASLIFWFATPLVQYSFSELRALHQVQSSSLQPFLRGAVFDFDNIYSFFNASFGLRVAPEKTGLISAAVVILLTGFFSLALRRFYSTMKNPARETRAITLALGLGSSFTLLFNPISQNNAYIQIAPLILAGIYEIENLADKQVKKIGIAVMAFAWLILTFSYNDLTQSWLRPLTLKPGAVALLPILLLVFATRDFQKK